jgi:UDP-N-acetylmuramate dehydrogenase
MHPCEDENIPTSAHPATFACMNLRQNVSLKKYNTFGIDVSAKYFLEVGSVSDIQNYLDDRKQFPLLILGGGSNILFTKNFNGTVLKNNIKGIEKIKEDDEYVYVKAGGGEAWHEFVMHCIKNNYAGLENLSLIPGSVGAAPIQNIGAYGVEQKEVFSSLEAINLHENKLKVFTRSECNFGYRDSIFKREAKNKFIITSVTFRLNKKPVFNTSYGAIHQELERMGIKELSISAVSQAVCNIRRSKLPDPASIGNAGSFFKNPTVPKEKYEKIKKEFPAIVAYPAAEGEMKLAAGWLIEQCGWKGKSFGNYGVHKDQALVLVNYGCANGNEIYELSEKILQSVKEKFGVVLEREVVII